MDARYKLLQEIWFAPKHESKDAFQDDGDTGIMIDHDRSVTVNHTIVRGKKKRGGVFQYRVHTMFDKFSKKWWPSLEKQYGSSPKIQRRKTNIKW